MSTVIIAILGLYNLCVLQACKDTRLEVPQLLFHLKRILAIQVENSICVLNSVCERGKMIFVFLIFSAK